MSRRGKIIAWIGGGLLGLIVVLVVAGIFVLRSDWFREQVRTRLITEVEKATGGTVEIGSFRFYWNQLRAEVHGFVIHGTEPKAGKPLLSADLLSVTLKVVSVLKRDIDLYEVHVDKPWVYLIVYPDGKTNVPEPKVKSKSDKTAAETILDLAIKHFNLTNGSFEVANKGVTPFDIKGQQLRTSFVYELMGPRYRGSIEMHPLEATMGKNLPLPMDVNMNVAVEKNRVQLTEGHLVSGDTKIDLSGALDDLVNVRGGLHYHAILALPDLAKRLGIPELQAGRAESTGTVDFGQNPAYAAKGDLHLYGVAYRDASMRLHDVRADGQIVADPNKITITHTRLSAAGAMLTKGRETQRVSLTGNIPEAVLVTANDRLELNNPHIDGTIALLTNGREAQRIKLNTTIAQVAYNMKTNAVQLSGAKLAGNVALFTAGKETQRIALNGTIPRLSVHGKAIELDETKLAGDITNIENGKATLREPFTVSIGRALMRGNDLAVENIRLAAVGGNFAGNATIRNMDQFHVQGRLAGFDIQRSVAMYSKEKLPWDGIVSGPVDVQGSLKNTNNLVANTHLTISPTGPGAPVRGEINAAYNGRTGEIDLGNSYVELPHSRINLTGALGNTIQVHFETTNLNDLLPALNVTNVNIALNAGSIVFDGTVTGKLDNPQINGHLAVRNAVYEKNPIDSLTLDVAANKGGVTVQNGVLARSTLQANFNGNVGLTDWKPEDNNAVTATASIHNANVVDLMAIAGQQDVKATGTVNADAQVSGTVGDPKVTANLNVSKGQYNDEPFDSLNARLQYASDRAEILNARLAAGQKQVDVTAAFTHPKGDFATGQIDFSVNSNRFGIDQVKTLAKERPGLGGLVQLTAKGRVSLGKDAKGQTNFRIADLNANVTATALRMNNQNFGDARITAETRGQNVVAHVQSDFAGSDITGDGTFQLAGDNNGTFHLTVKRIDFAKLREFLSPATSPREMQIAGNAEAVIDIAGPAIKPELWKASIQIPTLNVRPLPRAQAAPNATNRPDLSFHNDGPIRITYENQLARIENLHIVGQSTDIKVSGTADLKNEKNALNVAVNGNIDLALIHQFNADILSRGSIVANANIRGALNDPQIQGRMEMKNASFSMLDLPNGLSQANGVIIFDGRRAYIESMTARTGGGDVKVAGFVTYSGEVAFRVQLDAKQVRYRDNGLSVVADATITGSGTSEHSLVAGRVTITRIGFNPQSDLSSLLAKSAEPVKVPSAQTGLIGGMQFDIAIETAPYISFQSELAQDIQAEANLHLRGTANNPALLGRVIISQGQLNFFGTKYTINEGTINFYNPVKIEPVLNIDLETKARGVDVTITVSGTMEKLNITPRSDPPLQFSEIIALLATGKTPTSDPTILANQSATQPQSLEQMGASALVSQAIANPVSGRLQRFFGVSKLKIDPSITGQNNPQARLTLEQQVTQDITFTYITNVGNANSQVIRVEWAINRQWSAVAVREENGLFGLDFLYKRRF